VSESSKHGEDANNAIPNTLEPEVVPAKPPAPSASELLALELSKAEKIEELPTENLLCHYNTLLHAKPDEDDIPFEREMPPLRAAEEDSWLCTRRAEGFWHDDDDANLSSTGYPKLVSHPMAWEGEASWVERLRIVQWRLWLGPSELEDLRQYFEDKQLAPRQSPETTSPYWCEGAPLRCKLCSQAPQSDAEDPKEDACTSIVEPIDQAPEVVGDELEDWLERELEKINVDEDTPLGTLSQAFNFELPALDEDLMETPICNGEYYDHIGGVFWPTRYAHEVLVHHVTPSRRFYRFIREYNLSSPAASSRVRDILDSPMEELRPGAFCVRGNIAVTLRTANGNAFEMKVHSEDTIREVITLRLPVSLVVGAVLSWDGQELNRGSTVAECGFVSGCTALDHHVDMLLEVDAALESM